MPSFLFSKNSICPDRGRSRNILLAPPRAHRGIRTPRRQSLPFSTILERPHPRRDFHRALGAYRVVTHYYSHLSVATLRLDSGPLRVGDVIHIRGMRSRAFRLITAETPVGLFARRKTYDRLARCVLMVRKTGTPRTPSWQDHAQRSRLPHPIFARVVLTENLAGLLGKSLVTGRRRLGATPLRLRPIRSRALFSRYAHHRGSKL